MLTVSSRVRLADLCARTNGRASEYCCWHREDRESLVKEKESRDQTVDKVDPDCEYPRRGRVGYGCVQGGQAGDGREEEHASRQDHGQRL
jgi:hypothetical protein